jgi:hypothetical protein
VSQLATRSIGAQPAPRWFMVERPVGRFLRQVNQTEGARVSASEVAVVFFAVTRLTTITPDILCFPLGIEIGATARDGEWRFWHGRFRHCSFWHGGYWLRLGRFARWLPPDIAPLPIAPSGD